MLGVYEPDNNVADPKGRGALSERFAGVGQEAQEEQIGGDALISLSQQEREKFAMWLQQGAEGDNALAEQAQKLGAHGEVIARSYRAKAAAKLMVMQQLMNTESLTIGGEG